MTLNRKIAQFVSTLKLADVARTAVAFYSLGHRLYTRKCDPRLPRAELSSLPEERIAVLQRPSHLDGPRSNPQHKVRPRSTRQSACRPELF